MRLCKPKHVEISICGGIMNERFEKFTVSISRIERAIRRIENFEMADYNLRSPHISCLYFLYTTDARTASDLTLRCNDDKATVSRSLEYLEKTDMFIVRNPFENVITHRLS